MANCQPRYVIIKCNFDNKVFIHDVSYSSNEASERCSFIKWFSIYVQIYLCVLSDLHKPRTVTPLVSSLLQVIYTSRATRHHHYHCLPSFSSNLIFTYDHLCSTTQTLGSLLVYSKIYVLVPCMFFFLMFDVCIREAPWQVGLSRYFSVRCPFIDWQRFFDMQSSDLFDINVYACFLLLSAVCLFDRLDIREKGCIIYYSCSDIKFYLSSKRETHCLFA